MRTSTAVLLGVGGLAVAGVIAAVVYFSAQARIAEAKKRSTIDRILDTGQAIAEVFN